MSPRRSVAFVCLDFEKGTAHRYEPRLMRGKVRLTSRAVFEVNHCPPHEDIELFRASPGHFEVPGEAA